MRTHPLLFFHLHSPLSLWELAQDVNWDYSCPLELLKAEWLCLAHMNAAHRVQGQRMVDLLRFLAPPVIWLILFLKQWNLGTEGYEEHTPRTFGNRHVSTTMSVCSWVQVFFSESNCFSVLGMKWSPALRCVNLHKRVPWQWVPSTLQTQKFLLCRRWTVGAVDRMLTWHWVRRASYFCISRLCFPWELRGMGAVLTQCHWDKAVHSSMDTSQQLSLAGKYNRSGVTEHWK